MAKRHSLGVTGVFLPSNLFSIKPKAISMWEYLSKSHSEWSERRAHPQHWPANQHYPAPKQQPVTFKMKKIGKKTAATLTIVLLGAAGLGSNLRLRTSVRRNVWQSVLLYVWPPRAHAHTNTAQQGDWTSALRSDFTWYISRSNYPNSNLASLGATTWYKNKG